MGCFGSRFDNRLSNCTDLNTVGTQFVGGTGQQIDWCPADKILGKFASGGVVEGGSLEKLADFFNAGDAERAQKLGENLYNSVKTHLNWIKEQGGEDLTIDKVMFKKYQYRDCREAFEAVFTNLTEVSKVEIKAEEAPAGDAPPAEGEPAVAEDAAAEGGEEGAAPEGEAAPAGDAAPVLPTFSPFKDMDCSTAGGLDKIGEMLTMCAIKYPMFGDLVKAQLMKFEFNSECGGETTLAAAAGLIGAHVSAGATASKEVWFSGLVGGDDFDELTEMATRKDEILFPGMMTGWADKAQALEHLGSLTGDGKRVIYHATTNIQEIGAALATYRYSAVVDSMTEESNIHMIELTELEAPLRHKLSESYKEWEGLVGPALTKHAEEAAAAAAAAAEAAKAATEEPAKPDGEDKPAEGDPPAEDPPAE